MSSEIIINANPRETRVGVMESHAAVEFYIDHKRDEDIVGNIYKGRVNRVLPGMQVAFVDIGLGKAGFLYVSDVDILDIMEEHESLLTKKANEDAEKEDINFQRRRTKKDFDRSYLIEEVLQEGQEILVQVSKNPLGTKGARITTYITLPGRYLVFMPTIDHIGISRRIEDEEERKRLKKVIQDIRGTGAGYIVRTVGEGKNKEEFESDINFLGKLWSDIKNKAENSMVPALIYKDLDLIYRTLRDLFTQGVDQLIVDSPQVYQRCRDFADSYMPSFKSRVKLHNGKEPIFEAYGLEMEIEKALRRKVWLKSGGYITIDQTEALVAIDVNTGKYVGKENPEETILKTNLEAAKEIVCQLRLRNIGGLIVIDFIDMESDSSKEKVYQALEQAVKTDRSRTNILKISELGLVEMSRQRVRESINRILCQPCPYCDGKGSIKSSKTICYEVFDKIQRAVENNNSNKKKILINVHPQVADLLLGEESACLDRMEGNLNKKIIVKADYDMHQEQYELTEI
tara:strand:- start:2928 stop:4472 length:1545 start_codon:yes stop_codon:yes gene_type:complete